MAATTSRSVQSVKANSNENEFSSLDNFRDLLLKNYLYLPDVNIWQPFVIIGNIAAVFSACLAGLFGASRLIHAIAVDEIFGKTIRIDFLLFHGEKNLRFFSFLYRKARS